MAIRRPTLALAAALVLALLVGVQRADAATVLGSVDPSRPPEAFACVVYACPLGKTVGFRQLALHGSEVVVDEPGVLVSARVNAKRIAGTETPRIAVLRPSGENQDDIGVTVAGFAPVPIITPAADVYEVQDLHLRVEVGDSIGFLLPAGQVDLGTRMRQQPDGAVQWFMEPCGPCNMSGGTGRELLFDATVEPDADEDGLGDETQDPDVLDEEEEESDPLDEDEFDDWFDELEEDEEEEPNSRRSGPRRLRVLDLGRARNGNLFLTVGAPGEGRLGGIVTTSAGRWDLGLPRTIGVGESRAKRPAKVRLKLRLSRIGHRIEDRPGRRRARIVVYHLSRGGIKVTMRQIRL